MVAQIAALEHLSGDDLKLKWNQLFSVAPPHSCNRKQMISRLAYRVQELTFGGLSQSERNELDRLAGMQAPDQACSPRDPDKPLAGTILRREWQGIMREVMVSQTGFEYMGKSYRSLSAIAKEITGTKWNGLVFFGLRKWNELSKKAIKR